MISENLRYRSASSNQNKFLFDRIVLSVYIDMGLVDNKNRLLEDPYKIIDLISKVDLNLEQQAEFSERLVDKTVNDKVLFSMLPPAVLAFAYEETYKNSLAQNNLSKKYNNRLAKITNRIDELVENFANNTGFFFADISNISDTYEGYKKMFQVRLKSFGSKDFDEKGELYKQNLKKLGTLIADYDSKWNIKQVSEKDLGKIQKRWDAVAKKLNETNPSEEVLQKAANFIFLDEKGNEIPQFANWKGTTVKERFIEYKPAKNSRLEKIVDLAKHSVNMRHCGDFNVKITSLNLQKELDDEILVKLFEVNTAEQIVRNTFEHTDNFTNPNHFEEFTKNLVDKKHTISDLGWQAAMDYQVNQTAGFASRIKAKLKNKAELANGFFEKIFKPIQDINKRTNDSNITSAEEKRQQRIKFFVRLLKGFCGAFLVSSVITVIATAAAATAGVGLAVSLGVTSIIASISLGAWQIHKWRKDRLNKGESATLADLLKDKRMLAMLGTTALASIAMIFGMAGLTSAAAALGFGALAVGGTNSSVALYKDALKAGLSKKESLVWSVANVAAIALGGITGRLATTSAINSFNSEHPENTLFQNKNVVVKNHTEPVSETRTVYSEKALARAEQTAKLWHQNDLNALQDKVDAIKAFNAEHGTTIDPYRATILNADAGAITPDNMQQHVDGGGIINSNGNHKILTDQWAKDNGFSKADLAELKNMFKADGSVNPKAIEVAQKIDPLVSVHNEVGTVSSGTQYHYDGVLHQNAVDPNGTAVHTVYTKGESAFETKTFVTEKSYVSSTETYTPVKTPWIMSMLGLRNKIKNKKTSALDNPGALMDKNKPSMRVLYLTRAQAKKLDEIEKAIANTTDKATLLLLRQRLQTLKNALGRPSDSELENARLYARLLEANPDLDITGIDFYYPVPYKKFEDTTKVKQNFLQKLFNRQK